MSSKKQTSDFSELDWNFDAVPNEELVACCYWEYARESAFIRDVRQRCIQNWRAGGLRDERLSSDLGKLHSIGPHVDVLMRGIYFAPDDPHRIDTARNAFVTNSFPQPWQALPDDERDFRVRTYLNAGWYPATPFARAGWHEATEIAKKAEAEWDRVMGAYHRVRAVNPETSEVDLIAQGKLEPYTEIPVSIFSDEGIEVTSVAINWARFTNDEISNHFRKWVKANRPQTIPKPNGQGGKDRDWRIHLTRLGVMRLLFRHKALEIVDDRTKKFTTIWKTKQFSGAKWANVNKWYDARRDAGKFFRKLFPFLPRDEKPLSWERHFSSR